VTETTRPRSPEIVIRQSKEARLLRPEGHFRPAADAWSVRTGQVGSAGPGWRPRPVGIHHDVAVLRLRGTEKRNQKGSSVNEQGHG
jgi:hypothetical protein